MKRHVHYEAALEDYLQQAGISYVAVDEARRATCHDHKLKNFDLIVYSRRCTHWLADVKGRRLVTRPGQRRPDWQNWVTQADLDGLSQWQELFGPDFRGLLVFAYWVDAPADAPTGLVHTFRSQRYVFTGVPLEDYRQHARLRSPAWETVNLPRAEFARHIRPLCDWL